MRVLVVDDSRLIRQLATMALEGVAGWHVVAAESGAEALELAASESPEAILLDAVMPDMDGPATLSGLQASPDTREIPVILVTARDGAEDRAEFDAEVAERGRAEHGTLSWADRVRAAEGHGLTVTVLGAGAVPGRLLRVGSGWLLLGGSGRPQVLISATAVLAVAGLGVATAAATDRGRVYAAVDLRKILRATATERSTVRLTLLDGTDLTGTLDRVGADFVELAEHDPGEVRRLGAVRAVRTVPLTAIACATWAGG